MGLEPRQLMHLALVAEHGSFSAAAAATRMSQPALSSSIALLERAVGAPVLTRGRHGARLTALGQRLVRHAQAVQAQLAQAAEEARLARLGGEGPLTVGVTPITAANLVPQALGELRRRHRHVAVAIVEDVFDASMALLRNRAVDLVVAPIGVYPAAPDIIEAHLADDPLALVVRAGHVLARRRSIALNQLRDADWVLPSEMSAFRKQVEALFVTAGLQWPTFCITTNSMTALKSTVMHTDCVTVMAKRLVTLECEARRLTCVDLRDRGYQRALGVRFLRQPGLSPLAQQFLEILQAVARQEAG
jgi:DNA-binding transcriptional LysR family regulator